MVASSLLFVSMNIEILVLQNYNRFVGCLPMLSASELYNKQMVK
jgi:hypothetical protein